MDFHGAMLMSGITSEEFVRALRAIEAAEKLIPAEKLPAYRGAACVIRAANGVELADEKARKAEEAAMLDMLDERQKARIIYARAGRAEPLIAAIEAFSAAFCGGTTPAHERRAVDIIQRISDWYGQHGMETVRRPLAVLLHNADEMHNAGRALHLAQKADGRRRQ